jgi:hypothetical protein
VWKCTWRSVMSNSAIRVHPKRGSTVRKFDGSTIRQFGGTTTR